MTGPAEPAADATGRRARAAAVGPRGGQGLPRARRAVRPGAWARAGRRRGGPRRLPGRGAGVGGRVGLRQVDARAGAAAACSTPTPARCTFDGGTSRRPTAATCGRCGARCRSCSRTRSRRWTPGPPWATRSPRGCGPTASPARERRRPGARGARPGGPRAVPRPPLPASVLRRPAPAGRHRPGAGRRAALPGGRRAGLGARRVDPVADPEPAARPAGPPRLHPRVRGPRPGRGRAPVRPGRRDVPGAHRRGRHPRPGVREPAAPLHRGAAVGHPRAPTPSANGSAAA